MYPARLRAVLPLLGWVGMDIKAPFADYHYVTGIAGSSDKARASARLILDGGVDYEFRTTVHSTLLSHKTLLLLANELAAMGVARYVLQEFRQQGCSQPLPAMRPDYLNCDAIKQLGRQFTHFSVRGV